MHIESIFFTDQCLKIEKDTRFIIQDDIHEDKKCYILKNSKTYGRFTILNPNKKELYFLAIDKCVFPDKDRNKKCDFAIFDDQTFCFVEIKEVKIKQRKSSRKDAIQQLKSTIQLFKKHIDFTGYQLEAIVCFVASRTYPTANISRQNDQLYFREHLQTRLMEGNQKEFK